MSLLSFAVLAIMIGGGVYWLLSPRYMDMVLGFALASNGVNFMLIEASHPIEDGVDPLPQALILTAIVIGLALVGFLTAYLLKHESGVQSDER